MNKAIEEWLERVEKEYSKLFPTTLSGQRLNTEPMEQRINELSALEREGKALDEEVTEWAQHKMIEEGLKRLNERIKELTEQVTFS